jgi:hypothetical protein
MAPPITSRVPRLAASLSVILIITVLLLLLIEGASGFVLFIGEFSTDDHAPMAERRHTEYDRELGWINIPNVNIDDMYGPGIYLKTNGQAFRSDYDFSEKVPEGRVRLVCSGDSFTFGYGVDNDNTWCAQLTRFDSRLETVNMGQGGYGIDQAYLWYKRDARAIKHDLQVFAFVTDDFRRINRDNMFGYDKPVLKLKEAGLTLENVPVPRRSFMVPYITRNIGAFSELRIVELIGRLRPAKEEKKPERDRSYDISLSVFDELAKLNNERGSKLLVVYLPSEEDFSGKTDALRADLRIQLDKRGIHYLNLVDEVRGLPPNLLEKVFIPKGSLAYFMSEGHYTNEGNRYVAGLIHRALVERGLIEKPKPKSSAGGALH